MRNTLLIGLLTSVVATSSFASVADKKAIRAAEEEIAIQVKNMREVCGNADINVSVSWDEFKSFIETQDAQIKERDSKSEWVLDHTGQRTAAVVEALTKLCDDEDYKEEIAKITAIVVTPKPDYEDYNSEFAIDGSTIKVQSGHYMTRSWTDFTDRLKALF